MGRDRSQPFVWVTPAQSNCTATVHVLEGDAVQQEDLRNSPTSQTAQESMYASEAEAVESDMDRLGKLESLLALYVLLLVIVGGIWTMFSPQ